MPDSQPVVSTVATSVYTTPEFLISVVGLLVLLAGDKDIAALIPPGYQPVITKLALAATSATTLFGQWLRNRPVQYNLLPGQTQRVLLDRMPITQTTVNDQTSKPSVNVHD